MERRHKRHIGTPDHGGVQRIIQTGTIAPSLGDDGEQLSNRFDVIFAMYYITPPQVRAIRPEEARCIKEYRKESKAGKEKGNLFEHSCNPNFYMFRNKFSQEIIQLEQFRVCSTNYRSL